LCNFKLAVNFGFMTKGHHLFINVSLTLVSRITTPQAGFVAAYKIFV
jgi:hypothetical protein